MEHPRPQRKKMCSMRWTNSQPRFRKSVGRITHNRIFSAARPPLAEATTASLDALEAYSTGWKLHTTTGAIAALPFMSAP